MTTNEPNAAQEAEAIRRLVTEHGYDPLDALRQVRNEERGRRLAQRMDPHSKIVRPEGKS